MAKPRSDAFHTATPAASSATSEPKSIRLGPSLGGGPHQLSSGVIMYPTTGNTSSASAIFPMVCPPVRQVPHPVWPVAGQPSG